MSHIEQLQFVGQIAQWVPEAFRRSRVLEIGSLDINGSVRQFFDDCDYLGIDVGPGPGVDVVCEGQKFEGPDGAFDTVISCECMEHNPYWRETFRNMVRLCSPGGLVLMTCASLGRKEHGTTLTEPASSPLTVALGWDYYHNLSSREFAAAFPLRRWFGEYVLWTNWSIHDLYFAGIARKAGGKRRESTSAPLRGHAVPDWLGSCNSPRKARLDRFFFQFAGPLVGEPRAADLSRRVDARLR